MRFYLCGSSQTQLQPDRFYIDKDEVGKKTKKIIDRAGPLYDAFSNYFICRVTNYYILALP